jgi:uncharacterized protein YndB with AHSA1/START domain
MTTLEARTLSVSVDRPPAQVHAYVVDARNLPQWARGFARSVRPDGDRWLVETDGGPVRVSFAGPNPYGVADHRVTGEGFEVDVSMRVVPNGDGSEVVFTVLRAPGATDDDLARDVALVEQDLRTLRDLLEQS